MNIATEILADKEAFAEYYRLQTWLLLRSANSFGHCMRELSILRSQLIMRLRDLGMPGWLRNEYNNTLFFLPDYKDYLYVRDPRCGLCSFPIFTYQEATLDHIVPLGRGGVNKMKNKQLAHARCNVFKGSKIIKTFVKEGGFQWAHAI